MFRRPALQSIREWWKLPQTLKLAHSKLQLESLEERCMPATFTWNWTMGSNDWSRRENWVRDAGNDDYPGQASNTDIAVFNATSNNSVNVNVMARIARLTIADTFTSIISIGQGQEIRIQGTGSSMAGGTISGSGGLWIGSQLISSTFEWTAGTMSGAGSTWVVAGSTLNMTGTASKILNERPLTTEGTINWSGLGNISIRNGAQLHINPTGVFNVTGSGDFESGGGQGGEFSVVGQLNLNSAGTITKLRESVSFRTFPTAQVRMNTGSLVLEYASTNEGVYTIAANTFLTFAGPVEHKLQGCNLIGSGTTEFGEVGGPATLINVTATSRVAYVLDQAFEVTGVGNLQILGNYSWYNSTWSGSGVMDIGEVGAGGIGRLLVGEGAPSPKQMGRSLRNYGTVAIRNHVQVVSGANITNYSGATFDLEGAYQISSNGGGSFINQSGATLLKYGTGTASIALTFLGGNAGTVRVYAGKLQLICSVENLRKS